MSSAHPGHGDGVKVVGGLMEFGSSPVVMAGKGNLHDLLQGESLHVFSILPQFLDESAPS